MKDEILYNTVKNKIDELFKILPDMKDKYPYLIVIIMHDLARNIYPADLYIPLNNMEHRLNYIDSVLDKYMQMLNIQSSLGGYNIDYNSKVFLDDDVKVNTGIVYGKLWNEYEGNMVDEAISIIEERFLNNDIPINLLQGKKVLDAGCGSGRYSCALAKMGASHVIGMDYGVDGLKKAKELALKNNISNIEFIHASVLNMPFKDNEFDFVFHNGVFHHTNDLHKATKELYRVLKPGGYSWYYIYGAGGIFWYTRKLMNNFMKQYISQDYAINMLKMIGMPMNRFIFADNWYVPIETHTTKLELEKLFNSIGIDKFRRVFNGRDTDPDYLSENGTKKDKLMWGDGELRYFINK